MPVEVEVVGVNDVLKGLTFIDEDLYKRVKAAVNPLMKTVETKAKGFVASNTDVCLAGLNQSNRLLIIDHFLNTMKTKYVAVLDLRKAKIGSLVMAIR